MNLQFIATGVNRSGTVFTARLLTSLGIPCGHESIFNDMGEESAKNRLLRPEFRLLSYSSTHETFNNHTRIPHWVDAGKTVAESSYLAVPYLNWKEMAGIPLIHVVRNPLKVISSLIGDVYFFRDRHPNSNWEAPVYKFLPELSELPTQIERVCYYYMRWNETIEQQKNLRPYYFGKVEELPSASFFEFIKTQPTEDVFNDRAINHFGRRKKEYEPKDLPEGEVKQKFLAQMESYGYPAKNKKLFI